MRQLRTTGVGVCAALALASVAAAQVARSPQQASDGTVGVTIALQAGGESYRFAGRALCTHEPQGFIYAVRARQWRVEQNDGARHLALTFWRPAGGSSDMFTLYVKDGGKTHVADTVKTKDGGSPKGSGEVTFAAAGAGGTFTVNATAANGAKISGSITCDAFRAAVAEGGN